MKNRIRDVLIYVIFRTTGTLSFVRFIEWANMLRWLKPKAGERILDVACGVGELCLKMAKGECKVYGIDISEDAINIARRLSERANLASEFEVGDAEHLPYPDGYFDKIVCSSSLEHFEDDVKALKEMNRVLKANGNLIMTVDSLSYPISERLKQRHKGKYHVVNYYDRDKLKNRLELSEFNLIRSKYLLNSPLTSFFGKFSIKLSGHSLLGLVWQLCSLLFLPLFILSDRFLGDKEAGFTLIIEAKSLLVSGAK